MLTCADTKTDCEPSDLAPRLGPQDPTRGSTAEEHQVLRWRSDGAQLCMRSAVCSEPRTARGDEITSIAGIAGIALRDVQICFAS